MELGKPLFGGGESFFFFAESEADLRGAVPRVVVEAGAGDDRDADGFDEKFGEAHVFRISLESNGIGVREACDVRHDVIGAARLEDSETSAGQDFQQAFALGSVRSGELVVVALGKVKSTGAGLLERGRSTDGQEIVHLANRLRRFWR